MKVALYARCSTKHHNQDIENQLMQLRSYCEAQKLEVVEIFSDYESGTDENRPGFCNMFSAASKRKFDMVLFWSLDRFSRSGAQQTIQYLQRLESCGVKYRSFTEQYLDSAGIFADVIISVLATLAKQEKVRLTERVRAGLKKAMSKGRVGGRPKLGAKLIERIKQLKELGVSNRKIGQQLGISNSTVGLYA